MTKNSKHSNPLSQHDDLLFTRGEVSWEKSEADVWAEMEAKLSASPGKKRSLFLHGASRWVAAAVILLLVGLAGTVQFYSKTVETVAGKHTVATLPDGSTVHLNAVSSISYYPLKWRWNRTVEFEGEGYFKVQKGKTFTVKSTNGETRVLGTSFNIFARDGKYRVTCLTGKVEVKSGVEEKVTLLPNKHAELKDGKLKVSAMFSPDKEAIGWVSNYFFFAGRPLKEVIDEIERQYAVTIRLSPKLNNRNFGSNFTKTHRVEDVLKFVCKPMNLKFVKQSENVYLVVEKS